MNTTNKTAAQVEAMLKDEANIKAVSSLFQAIAFKEILKPIIEAKQLEIINFYKFKVSDEWQTRGKTEFKIISNPKHMYLANDIDFNLYFAELQSFYYSEACPVKPTKKGNCPLLEAESLEREIFANVVDLLTDYTGLNYNMISRNLKTYKDYKELILSLFAPLVKSQLAA